MLKIKIKGQKDLRIIPAGYDTQLSPDGKTLTVVGKDGKPLGAGVDKEGKPTKAETFDPATVSAVVRA